MSESELVKIKLFGYAEFGEVADVSPLATKLEITCGSHARASPRRAPAHDENLDHAREIIATLDRLLVGCDGGGSPRA